MDKPLTPSEELANAVTTLTLSLEKLRDALEILACEMIVAPRRGSTSTTTMKGPVPPRPE